MFEELKSAFADTHDGYSADRVVADPVLNSLFVERCRDYGLTEPPRTPNQHLLNMRKASKLSDIKTTKRTTIDSNEFLFAAEVAVRLLERRDNITLDQVICDPELAREFDCIAESISPGFRSLDYRWAALYLRKVRKLSPERMGHLNPAKEVQLGNTRTIDVETIPIVQGLYIFYSTAEALYVGEASNLRRRVAKHLDHSDNRNLARWLWEHTSDDVHLEIHVLPENTSTRGRRAMEGELIASRRPIFNVRLP